jgi:hypothetical protein
VARNPQLQTNVDTGNVTITAAFVSNVRPNTFTHTQSNINTLSQKVVRMILIPFNAFFIALKAPEAQKTVLVGLKQV